MTQQVQTAAHDLGGGMTLMVVVEGRLVEKTVVVKPTPTHELSLLERVQAFLNPARPATNARTTELVPSWRWSIYRKAPSTTILGVKVDGSTLECVKISDAATEADALREAFLYADGYVEKWHEHFGDGGRSEYPYVRAGGDS